MASTGKTEKSRSEFTVAWLCALAEELTAAKAALDEEFEFPSDDPGFDEKDLNTYIPGRIGKHLVVVAFLKAGAMGNNAAAALGQTLSHSFKNLRFGLMVGVGAGVPSIENDVRLGDVVVSMPARNSNGVVQWDMGKDFDPEEREETFTIRSHNKPPPDALLSAIRLLQSKEEVEGAPLDDYLGKMFKRYPRIKKAYSRPFLDDPLAAQEKSIVKKEVRKNYKDEDDLEAHIHYGLVASGNSVVSSRERRDEIVRRIIKLGNPEPLCIEMEAAGLMDAYPCLIIRGICDFADKEKNDAWHKHAAAVAAAYAAWLLDNVHPVAVKKEPKAAEVVRSRINQHVGGVNSGLVIAESHGPIDFRRG